MTMHDQRVDASATGPATAGADAIDAGATGAPAGPGRSGLSRRRFISYLIAAPVVTMGVRLGLDGIDAAPAAAAITSPPQVADIEDLGDLLIQAGLATSTMLTITVDTAGIVHFAMPRMESGQGLTTAVSMLVAEELSVPLSHVRVTLLPADTDLLENQLTGGSNSIRSLYIPLRAVAAGVRGRLLAAAVAQFGLQTSQAGDLSITDGVISGLGYSATYGELATAAADPDLVGLDGTPKPQSDFTLVGTPQTRVDAMEIITGKKQFTLDLEVCPAAMPCMVRRPPTLNGTVVSVANTAAVEKMPGVIATTVIPSGVAVVAETFGQCIDAVDALEVTWGPGSVDGASNASVRAELIANELPLPVPPVDLLAQTIDIEFDWAFANHAPMETNCAIADVKGDTATVWSGLQSPIIAGQTIAAAIGIPAANITMNVITGGGSFGRKLFFDAAMEAAQISSQLQRPVKLMWHRTDDMRHGRMHPQAHHHLRATYALGNVLTYEHRVTSISTDFSHGLGEILTATVARSPILGNLSFSETVFETTVTCPYNFGAVDEALNEVDMGFHTASMRSVYSYNTRGSEEILVDELAAAMGQDPYEFRMSFLQNARQQAVLAKVAELGDWGRTMPRGTAQGIAFHQEYQSMTACLVEIDCTTPDSPRVTAATIAVDAGLAINPRGLESQMIGGLSDAISLVLMAGIHFVDGLPLEDSYAKYHYARQYNSPYTVNVYVFPPTTGQPGGAGELGVPAATGAVANAYARATGTKPRRFPLIDPPPTTGIAPPSYITVEPIIDPPAASYPIP
jgi:isoquinoline 1-oxidoreductase beta subunit